MCLGVPGEVIKIEGNIGTVQIGDAQIQAGLDLIPAVAVGDHVLVHAGFAVQIIDKQEALVTWLLIKELAKYEHAE
jgi:hydrogenase expression/formation protein HypC